MWRVTRIGASVAIAAALLLEGAQPSRARTEKMVRDQIESRGVRNQAVLRALRDAPRELFMPAEVRPLAYEDRAVPIGYGQTISQPYIVGFMTDALDIHKEHRVLEIGTGSGYQAAILSLLANAVYTMEIVPQLAASATETLKKLGHRNVFVRHGDGYKGWPEKAPFDRIVLTASPPEIPQALLNQLAGGGKLLAPVGKSGSDQELVLVEKTTDGKITKRALLPVRFVPMVRLSTP